MRLKLVVASIGVMGLVGCPMLAAASANYKVANYKGEIVTPRVVPQMQKCNPTLAKMTQNVGHDIFYPDWYRRIQLHSGFNTDFTWGRRNMNYMGVDTHRISLNNLYVGMYGDINSWTDAYVELNYNNATEFPYLIESSAAQSGNQEPGRKAGGIYSSVGTQQVATGTIDNLTVPEAYVTFHGMRFIQLPLFVQVGKQFLDFGRYVRNPMTRSMTQTMSESTKVLAKLGVMSPIGLHGSIYAFDNPSRKTTENRTKYNFGANVGYDHPDHRLGYDLGIGYINDMTGIDDVRYAIAFYQLNVPYGSFQNFKSKVGGYAAYADLNSGPFDVSVRFTSAASRFNVADLAKNSVAVGSSGAVGAKPDTFDLTGAYNFNYMGKKQALAVSYQTSREAVALLLPRHRFEVDYSVDAWKNVNLSLGVAHDEDYGSAEGGTNLDGTTIKGRVAVQFG